jgi:hypothetical protein
VEDALLHQAEPAGGWCLGVGIVRSQPSAQCNPIHCCVALATHPPPPIQNQKVYVAVGIDDERPFIPPESELPSAPAGRRLELYKQLMQVGAGGGGGRLFTWICLVGRQAQFRS